MTGDAPPEITRVTGGVAGMTATYDLVRALAARLDEAGDRMRDWAATGGRILRDPELLASAPLSPLTFAEVEARVSAATVGPHGVLISSLAFEADARLVRAAVVALEGCDDLVATGLDALDYAVGRAAGTLAVEVAPYAVAIGVVAVGVAKAGSAQLPDTVRARLAGGVEAAADEAEEWVVSHPEETQQLVNTGGGLLDGLLTGLPAGLAPLVGLSSFHPTLGAAAGDLAGLYGSEGRPHVHRRPDLRVPVGRVPPDDLADLIGHLEQTNDLSPPERPGDQGTIEVQTLRAPDGRIRHIVYLPGTDQPIAAPPTQDDRVRDLPADLRLIAGQDTAYADGIRQAMTMAGIGPRDPVLLVGHSQGGMEAAAILAQGSPFQVTHVVTAGAPTALADGYPAGSHVLSLEHRGDVVPLLDGHDSADSRQQVTVEFDDHETSILGNHRLQHYVEGARAADASTDPSVREQLASLRAAGFLGTNARVSSQILQITR